MLKVRYLIKLLGFLVVFLIVLNSTCYFLIKYNWHIRFIENGQIYNAISKSRKENKNMEIVILGGSVANQMYNNNIYSDSINSFCTVMPITIAGQYLILKNILKHSDLTGKQVIMVMHPNGFTARLYGPASYHYFLKPFYNREFIPLMDSYLTTKLSAIPLKWMFRFPMMRCTNWTPESGQIDLVNAGAKLSPLSINYLHEIEKLSHQYGFSFKILPPVQPEKNKDIDYELLKKEISSNQLDSIFYNYFEKMQYLKDDLFLDGFHVNDPNILNDCAVNLLYG